MIDLTLAISDSNLAISTEKVMISSRGAFCCFSLSSESFASKADKLPSADSNSTRGSIVTVPFVVSFVFISAFDVDNRSCPPPNITFAVASSFL